MKLFLSILLVSFSSIDPTEIAKINALKKEAEKAYLAGNFEKSIEKYSYLLDTLAYVDEAATMNLAHSYYKTKNSEEAIINYQKLQDSSNETLKSLAYQQLGVLSNDPKTLEKSLSYFKEAIKSDPSNDDARYNYELLKKKLKEQQQDQENQDQQDQEKENKDEENKENKDQKDQEGKDQNKEGEKEGEQQENKNEENQEKEGKEGEESEEQKKEQNKEGEESEEEKQQSKEQQEEKEGEEDTKDQAPTTSEKLKQMNISEEKAKMILEALRNNEIQYIQQNRRKATKRKDKNKPDW